jgi:hypothetical protein
MKALLEAVDHPDSTTRSTYGKQEAAAYVG